MKHHKEITENLEHLQKMGIDAWTEHEEKRWSCPKCKAVLSWYDSSCPGCNTPRSKDLFSL
jgi:rubrerythrin